MPAMRRLASWSPAQMAGRRLMPAIAALLALLVAAILLAFNAVSAEETPTHQAAINDDPNLNRPLPTTTCDHSINSDATCDLSMRLWNRHTTTEATFTLLEVGVNGAFDSSAITPDNTERYSTQTLGDCPCEYTVPPRGYETFRMTIRVGTMTDGYRTSNIRIFFGANHIRSQTPLNEYRLRLVDVTTPPDPTVITVGEITDHTVALTWTADSHASSYIVFWWPKGAMSDSSMGATNDKAYTITALDADTLYVIKVQALVRGKNLASDQVDVRTTGAPVLAQCSPPPDGNGMIDYDQDDDGLIEVCNLTQLDAIRHDLNGDGAPDIYPRPAGAPDNYHEANVVIGRYIWTYGDFTQAERATNYNAVFTTPKANMGCKDSAAVEAERVCHGYELTTDLDFDENGNGLRDDRYTTGSGWLPIIGKTYSFNGGMIWSRYGKVNGQNLLYRMFKPTRQDTHTNNPYTFAQVFHAVFEGNGHTIANLYVNRNNYWLGLFGYLASGEIRNVGLIAPTIRGRGRYVGTIVGEGEDARISASYARDVDVRNYNDVGGLIGNARATTIVESYATGQVHGNGTIGGLAGILNNDWILRQGQPGRFVNGQVLLSFASVRVSGYSEGIGGLIGHRVQGAYAGTYATGQVSSVGGIERDYFWGGWLNATVGGLVGIFWNPLGRERVSKANYVTGQVVGRTADAEAGNDPVGGFVGECYESRNVKYINMMHSYWDTQTTGQPESDCTVGINTPSKSLLEGKTTAELQGPTNANAYDSGSIYEHWRVTIDGVTIDPWEFGTSSEYPTLNYCSDPTGTYCPLREYHAIPKVVISGGGPVTEGGTAVFTVSVERTRASDLDVYVWVREEGLFVPADDQLGRHLVTIPAGNLSTTVSVETVDDEKFELDGRIVATFVPMASYTVREEVTAGIREASVLIRDNDPDA